MPSSLRHLLAIATLAIFAAAALPRPAFAAAASTPPTATPTVWRPHRPLLTTGAALFASGYVPNFALAVPSTAKIVGTAALIYLSLGTLLMSCGSRPDDPHDPCFGDRGAVQLLIPVAGPVLFAQNHPRDSFLNPHGHALGSLERTALYVSAGLQAAGLAAVIAGIALGKREPLGSAPRGSSPSLAVAPLAAPGSLGVSLSLERW